MLRYEGFKGLGVRVNGHRAHRACKVHSRLVGAFNVCLGVYRARKLIGFRAWQKVPRIRRQNHCSSSSRSDLEKFT